MKIIIIIALLLLILFCYVIIKSIKKPVIENLQTIKSENINLVYKENDNEYYLSIIPSSYCDDNDCEYSVVLKNTSSVYSIFIIEQSNIGNFLYNVNFDIRIVHNGKLCGGEYGIKFIIEHVEDDKYRILYEQPIINSNGNITYQKYYLSKCNPSVVCEYSGENIMLCTSIDIQDALLFNIL